MRLVFAMIGRQGIAVAVGAFCAVASPVAADLFGAPKSPSALFRSQTAVLDGRAATQYAGSTRLLPQREHLGDLPSYTGAYRGPYVAVARAAARRHAVPEDLFLRLVEAESAWNETAVSHKGARGLAQLMPETARLLGVDPDEPSANLDGGARYLRRQYETFGTWRLALAAYNAGPEAVERHGGVPPYSETEGYVKKILGR